MKLEWDTERAMLQLTVTPSVEQVKQLLKEGKQEEACRMAAKDILGLLMPYRDIENEKVLNAPESLKSASNVKRMEEHAELMGEAIGLLYDEKTQVLRPCEEWDMDRVGALVARLVNS